MNNKSFFTLLLAGLLLISCKEKQKTSNENRKDQEITEQKSTINKDFLIGSWKDQSESALNFSLYPDGTGKSDNMETLLYQKWHLKNNQLYLTAQSIGNGTSSIVTEVYQIQKLDEHQMILKSGEMIFKYNKIDKSSDTFSESKSKILRGKLALGHEGNGFEPCGSDNVFWVIDKTGKLENLYTTLTKNKKAYTSIFVEIEIIDKGKAADGFPADYDATYEVINILEARELLNRECE